MAEIKKSKSLQGRLTHLVRYSSNNWQVVDRHNKSISIYMFNDRKTATKYYQAI